MLSPQPACPTPPTLQTFLYTCVTRRSSSLGLARLSYLSLSNCTYGKHDQLRPSLETSTREGGSFSTVYPAPQTTQFFFCFDIILICGLVGLYPLSLSRCEISTTRHTLVVDVAEKRHDGEGFSLLHGGRCAFLSCLRLHPTSKVEGFLATAVVAGRGGLLPQAIVARSGDNGALGVAEGERRAQLRCRAG